MHVLESFSIAILPVQSSLVHRVRVLPRRILVVARDRISHVQHDRVEAVVSDLEAVVSAAVAAGKAVLRNQISASLMHRRRISKPRSEAARASSDSLRKLPSMMILSDARRASRARDKRRISAISDRHSLIVLVKKWKSVVTSRSKNFQIKLASHSHVSWVSS